jgi:hypothetical protein
MSNQLVEVIFKDELTQEGLAELRAKYPADLIFNMADDEVFKAARKTRTEKNKLVEAIDRRRIDVCNEVKQHGDSLIKQIDEIYSVVVEPFEIEDKRRKDIEKQKKEQHEALIKSEREKIAAIGAWVPECIGKSSAEIQDIIEAVDMIDTSLFHKDVIHEAIEIKQKTINQLGQSLAQAIQNEQAEAQRQQALEAERIAKRNLDIEQAIGRLRMLPMDYMQKHSSETRKKIDELQGFTPTAEKFGERTGEAAEALKMVLQQLDMIAGNAERMEDMQQAEQESESLDKYRYLPESTNQPQAEPVQQQVVSVRPIALEEAKQQLSNSLGDKFANVQPTLEKAVYDWSETVAIDDSDLERLLDILRSFGAIE